MKSTARSIPTALFALLATLLTAFLVLFAPLSVSAHDALVSSSPGADATVETLPAELTLAFSAKLIDGEGATDVVVTDAAGTSVTDGAASVDGAVVTQPLMAQAQAGEYHVVWKVVSSDGHATDGEFSFTVAESTVTTQATESAAPATDEATAAPGATGDPGDSESAEDPTGMWLLAVLGILIVAAAVIMLFSRRGNRKPSDSDSPSGR